MAYGSVARGAPQKKKKKEAVEFGELDQFLRLKEEWDPFEEDKPLLRAIPVGIPGAYAPAQMNPEHISPAPSPSKTKPPRRKGEVDAGQALGDATLHGVDVTEDDLETLVKELGLTGADAEDLIKGLSGDTSPTKKDTAPSPSTKEDEKEEAAAAAAEPTPTPQKKQPFAEDAGKPDVWKAEEPAVKAVEPDLNADAAEESTNSRATEKAEAEQSVHEEATGGEKSKSEPAV